MTLNCIVAIVDIGQDIFNKTSSLTQKINNVGYHCRNFKETKVICFSSLSTQVNPLPTTLYSEIVWAKKPLMNKRIALTEHRPQSGQRAHKVALK